MASSAGKVAVRDSFDEDVSDDVDDEVFIRDGRNGFKMDEERGVKRPLMPPRRRLKSKVPSSSYSHPQMRLGSLLAPCCYGVLALVALLGLIALTVILVKFLPFTIDQLQFWKSRSFPSSNKKVTSPCTAFIVKDVWTKSFPKLTSETAVRLSDVNNDKVLDVIIGYGTGADGRNVPDFVCNLYFRRDPPCLGGIVALDGRNGEILWQHWTQRPVFTVDCDADLTDDNVHDCIVGGKGGLLHAVNGHDGSLLWHLEDNLQREQVEPLVDIYSAQYIADIDGDKYVDVIAAHTASYSVGSGVRGHLLLVSGKTGRLLRVLDMPGASESYYAPQLLVDPDGNNKVLIGTGGTGGRSRGGIYIVPLSVLATADKLVATPVLMSDMLGVLAPSVLVDINHDGIEDIIVSLFNSTVVAIDGSTFALLWNYTFSDSQSLSPPTPGYFNGDDTPDFLIKYQNGPGFPVYFYSQTNILDGKTGLPLLDHPIVDSVGSQMGGLSISMEGIGNDWFLFWTANCVGYEGMQTPYSFTKGSSLLAQSQADLCRLRFNTSMSATLWAINQHVKAPGQALYSSEWRKMLEYNNSQSSLNDAVQYLSVHPDFWNAYDSQVKIDPIGGAETVSQSGTMSQIAEQFSQGYRSDDSMPSTLSEADVDRPDINAGRIANIRGMDRVEFEVPDYPHIQLKNHRLPVWTQEQKGWDVDIAPGSDLDDSHSSNDYSGLLADLRHSNIDARETASNFLQAIHDERVKGDKQVKRKTRQLKTERSYNDKGDNIKESFNSTDSKILRGIYHLTSTGTLAPPISGEGIDLILVSYWVPPSESAQVLSPNDMQCIQDGMARASTEERSKFSNMDEDTLELAITAECLLYRYSSSSSLGAESHLEPHPSFIPQFFAGIASETKNNIDMKFGQLTVYRLNLQCQCKNLSSQYALCANILPFDKQSWPSFMGPNGKGYFHPRV